MTKPTYVATSHVFDSKGSTYEVCFTHKHANTGYDVTIYKVSTVGTRYVKVGETLSSGKPSKSRANWLLGQALTNPVLTSIADETGQNGL